MCSQPYALNSYALSPKGTTNFVLTIYNKLIVTINLNFEEMIEQGKSASHSLCYFRPSPCSNVRFNDYTLLLRIEQIINQLY